MGLWSFYLLGWYVKKILEYKQIVLLVVFMGFNMAAILIHEEK